MEPEIQEISLVSQSSAETVVSIDDLLVEIFLCLPVKSLIRFKSVSKRWQSLISDPGFVIRRNPNPNPATGLILQVSPNFQIRPDRIPYAYIVCLEENTTSPQIRTLKKCSTGSWPNFSDETIIRSCCNGLILTCRTYKTNEHHQTRNDNYVCNPTTNKFSRLPKIPDELDWVRPMWLAFDPSKSPHYRVLCALYLLLEGPGHDRKRLLFQFTVYSSKTGCWRKSCAEPFDLLASVDFGRGAYWNGAMHWVNKTKSGKSIYFNPEEDRISLEMMPTPPNVLDDSPYYYFGESCGHLHYMTRMESGMDVYELRSDYSEWFVKYRIRDPSFSVGRVPHPHLCTVVRGKSHDDDSFAVLLIEGKLERYNFLNKTREIICQVKGTPLESTVGYSPFQHAESLCSV